EGEAFGVLWSAGFTGGRATTDMRLLLHRRSIIVDDRADTALLGEPRVAAVAGQVQVEVLVGLLLAVALDVDRDGLGGLAGCEGQRATVCDVVVVAGRRRPVHGLKRHGYRLVVGSRERDRERERRLAIPPLCPGDIADADARLVIEDGADPLGVADRRTR